MCDNDKMMLVMLAATSVLSEWTINPKGLTAVSSAVAGQA